LAKITVDDVLRQLSEQAASTKCSELCALMEALGYRIRRCGSAGHRVVKHPAIARWFGTNFNGGHGSDDVVKKRYVDLMRKAIEEHADTLRKLRGEKNARSE